MYEQTIAYLRSLPIGARVHGVDKASEVADRLEAVGKLHAKLLSEQDPYVDSYVPDSPLPSLNLNAYKHMRDGVWVDCNCK
jgi:hypothetical protein